MPQLKSHRCSFLALTIFVIGLAGLGLSPSYAHQSQPTIDPLAGWDTITYCDHITEIHDAAHKLLPQTITLARAFHMSSTYNAELTNELYQVVGEQIGLALSARGFIHHYEQYRRNRNDPDYPPCLTRLSNKNHILTDTALIQLFSHEEHLNVSIFSALFKKLQTAAEDRFEHLRAGTAKHFPHVPDSTKIYNFLAEVRLNFINRRTCSDSLIP